MNKLYLVLVDRYKVLYLGPDFEKAKEVYNETPFADFYNFEITEKTVIDIQRKEVKQMDKPIELIDPIAALESIAKDLRFLNFEYAQEKYKLIKEALENARDKNNSSK